MSSSEQITSLLDAELKKYLTEWIYRVVDLQSRKVKDMNIIETLVLLDENQNVIIKCDTIALYVGKVKDIPFSILAPIRKHDVARIETANSDAIQIIMVSMQRICEFI